MGWLPSLIIGLLTAVLGCSAAGFVATLCVRWYRISGFEGGSGYYVVFIGLLGGVVGLILGVVSSRFVPVGEGPAFLKGLGVALGSTSALVAVVGFVSWLAADLPPEIDGRPLYLEIEVRGPKSFTLPIQLNEYGASAGVDLVQGRRQPTSQLRLEEATQVDGRWIVNATVPLDTSASRKYLRVYFNKENGALFPLPLRRRPATEDFAWSPWVESGWNADKPEPVPEEKFNLRYRVRQIAPPPPGPTPEEIAAEKADEEQATFDALAPDAPITDWLPYTRYGTKEERVDVAIENITARENFVPEFKTLMLSPDPNVAAEVLRLIEHLPQPPATLLAPVVETGRTIAGLIRKVNATTPDEDPRYLGAAEVSVRFSAWMVAVRTLREKSGGDFTPELRGILELARVRSDSHAIRGDVLRVASYYMHQWTGLAPLANDPPPR